MKKQWMGMVMVMFGLVGLASAALVQTNTLLGEYELPTPLTNDLVNDGAATLAQELCVPDSGFSDGSPYMLNDGKVLNDPDNYWGGGQVCNWGSPWMVQYTLDTTTNTLGYDIEAIGILGGWKDGGVNRIECTIAHKLVGDAEFTSLGYFEYNPGDAGGTQITLSDDQGTLLSGVSVLKFSFGTGYIIREVDVTGTPTVPEPATMGLLAVGGVLALLRKRR